MIDSLRCPVCGSARTGVYAKAQDVEYCTSTELYTYRRCEDCGSLYLENPPVEQLRKIYPPNYYSYQHRVQSGSFAEKIKERLDAALFRKIFTRLPGESLNVLDVGGGSGWLLTLARRVCSRVKETHEVDFDENARELAEASGHIFHACPVESFSSPVRFDLILMLNVIEHVPDPAAVLNAMGRLLKPGGLLLIKTPNVDTLDCRLFRHNNWGGFHCPRHFVLFNKRSIVELAGRSGLTVDSASYTQGAPQWACSVLGWLGRRGWIRISAERPLYMHPLYPVACAAAAAFDFVRSPFMPTAQMFLLFRGG